MIIGLTGGIGSGKTTCTKVFKTLGVPIISSDQIVHHLLDSNTEVQKKISSYFGVTLFDEKGSLDRKKLRIRIFQNKADRIWLEKLLHPFVKKSILHQIKILDQDPYLIVEIPLLLEANFISLVDRILVVDCSTEAQITRITKRDRCTRSAVESILNTQVTRTERLAAANDLIDNTGEAADLPLQIQRLHEKYIQLTK